MQVVDLSHTIEQHMPVYPGDTPVNVELLRTVKQHGFAHSHLSIGSHTGTHLDISAHLFQDAPTLDWMGPDNFTGWGCVVDLTHMESPSIEVRHLDALEGMEALDFVLLRTDWDQHWGSDRYFDTFPTLSPTASRYLGGLGIKGVGIDTCSPDPVQSPDLPAHAALLNHGLVIVENLCNLKELPDSDFIFSALPLKIKDGEGSPVRAVGMTF